MQHIQHHFLEIRLRFFYTCLCFGFTFLTCYYFQTQLVYIIGQPFFKSHARFVFTEVGEAFYMILEICGLFTVFAGFPYLAYQVWSFFTPSWYRGEKKQIDRILGLVLILFLFGILFVYWVILPKLCGLLLSFGVESLVELAVRIQSYITLLYRVGILVFIVFLIPFGVWMLFHTKWLDSFHLCENRKLVLVGCLFAAAVLSPPDIPSQFAIWCLFFGFYEFLISLGFLFMYSSTKYPNHKG